MTVLVGTAGFSYRDWKGNFYPSDIKPQGMLEEYATHFPVVEINSTYYAIPLPQVLFKMALRTPPWFQFTVKANREMTHEREGSGDVFAAFRKALRPLEDAGKLGCVLAQFPWGFKRTDGNTAYLEVLAEKLAGLDAVVEFRNSEWEGGETLDLLRRLGLGYVCVDEPVLRGLMPGTVAATGPVAYVRFHGRNRETWWDRKRESWERYNYLYSTEELLEWAPKVQELAEGSDRTYIIFNNHYKGQAPANARMFEEMLRGLLGESLVTAVEGADEGDSLF